MTSFLMSGIFVKKVPKYETIVETFHTMLVSVILVGRFAYFSGFVLVVSLEFVSVRLFHSRTT